MRKVIQIIFVTSCCCLPCLAQVDTLISYSEVVPVDSVSGSELFTRARAWYNNSFVSSKDVLQIVDKETGELAGKGNMDIKVPVPVLGKVYYSDVVVKFALKIWVKDGKYKYELTDLKAMDKSVSGYDYGVLTSSDSCPIKMAMIGKKKADKYWGELKHSAEKSVIAIIESLKASMSKQGKTDDW